VTKTPARNAAVGASGERIAAALLERAGCRIVARNWRCPGGELDLVALDGETLVCAEVRVRTGVAFGSAAESVLGIKTQRVLRAVAAFLDAHPEHAERIVRVDVIALTLDRAGRIIETAHFPNALAEG
jgi:putative endonuclease